MHARNYGAIVICRNLTPEEPVNTIPRETWIHSRLDHLWRRHIPQDVWNLGMINKETAAIFIQKINLGGDLTHMQD